MSKNSIISQTNPLMVSVGGKTPDLTKCELEKEPDLVKYNQNNFISFADIKGQMYKFTVEGITVYIEDGCTFRIDKTLHQNKNSVIVITDNSVFSASEIKYCTDQVLITGRSLITIVDEVSFGDMVIKGSSISAENCRMFRATIDNTVIDAKETFENFDNWLRFVTIDGFTSVHFRSGGYNGNEEFTLMGNEDAAQNLIVKDLTLPSHHQDFSCLDEDLDIILVNRVDIGTFAGVRPLPFVRAGRADIIVSERLFPETEFFQEETFGPEVGTVPISTIEKNHPSIIKTRKMMEDHKQWSEFVFQKKELRRSTDTEHMLVKSILMGIVSRINVYKTLNALN